MRQVRRFHDTNSDRWPVLQLIRMLLIIVGVFFICWGPKLLLNAMKKHQLHVLRTEAAFDISVSACFFTLVIVLFRPLHHGHGTLFPLSTFKSKLNSFLFFPRFLVFSVQWLQCSALFTVNFWLIHWLIDWLIDGLIAPLIMSCHKDDSRIPWRRYRLTRDRQHITLTIEWMGYEVFASFKVGP